ncbi:MAG: tryptophan--tRNA ligase [Flavobacteriales bacterium]|nr:tryptophan--tRNA ligase [Flavobacteriales bacterium]
MARILTGVQATGVPHLGNILGSIEPAVQLSKQAGNDTFLFIANMHSLTAIRDAELVRENTYSVAAAYLAFGYDTSRNTFYRQSDVPEVTELMWYLNCWTPFPMLQNAHSFKDKSSRLSEVNAGLFTYPVLMAADILLYDAEFVPVGKDQQQHLEMARDMAGSFNHQYGDTLVLPEAKISKEVMVVPGTDGQKMSKSYNNYINLFQTDKKLRKQVMGIVTDSTPLEEPKDPDTCNVVALYKLVASQDQIAEMEVNYRAGGYGYGHAKQALYEALVTRFEEPRCNYEELMADKAELDRQLTVGAEKARAVASATLARVRAAVGMD